MESVAPGREERTMSAAALRTAGRATALAFDEREPHERGFARIFDREIAPGLAALEKERLALKRTLTLRAILPAAGLVATVAAFGWATSAAEWWAVILPAAALVATIGLGVYAYAPAGHFADRSRELIMGPVCGFLGDLTYERNGSFDLTRFRDCGVVGGFNRSNVEDVFTGRHRGTGFQMAEAVLENQSGFGKNKRTVTVFRGLLIAVKLGESARGRVLIGRESGKIGNTVSGWLTSWKGLKRVEVPHADFEARFEVYADDAEEARRLLGADFLDTMIAIAKAHEKAAVTAGFCEGAFLLALPMCRNLFEPGSIFRSVYGCEANIRELLGQITVAHRVIDFLNGERHEQLA
jgi:hypothetical protein